MDPSTEDVQSLVSQSGGALSPAKARELLADRARRAAELEPKPQAPSPKPEAPPSPEPEPVAPVKGKAAKK